MKCECARAQLKIIICVCCLVWLCWIVEGVWFDYQLLLPCIRWIRVFPKLRAARAQWCRAGESGRFCATGEGRPMRRILWRIRWRTTDAVCPISSRRPWADPWRSHRSGGTDVAARGSSVKNGWLVCSVLCVCALVVTVCLSISGPKTVRNRMSQHYEWHYVSAWLLVSVCVYGGDQWHTLRCVFEWDGMLT